MPTRDRLIEGFIRAPYERRQPGCACPGTKTILNKGKYGRVIPVKVIVYKDLIAQDSSSFGASVFTIGVNNMTECSAIISDTVEMYADAGASNANTNLFRWADGKLIYNPDTKAPPGMTMVINMCYRTDVYLDLDGNLATTGDRAKLSYNRYAVFQPTK